VKTKNTLRGGHYMSGWVRDPKRRLVRVEFEPKLETKSEPQLKEME